MIAVRNDGFGMSLTAMTKSNVIPAKLVLDYDRGAGIRIYRAEIFG